MPRKSQAASAEECCAKCERDVAALRKEVAALKKELAKRPAGEGGDPRVDTILELLKQSNSQRKFLEKKGV